MNNEQNLQATDLDSLVGSNHLEMMKAALPYMNVPQQRFISLFVKFNELRRTVSLFEEGQVAAMGLSASAAANEGEGASPVDLLGAIKPFGSPQEQDFIDLILNFFQGFKLAGSYSDLALSSVIPPPRQEENGNHQQPSAPPQRPGGPLGRIPLDQFKNFIPPEQQSRLETIQLMMAAMQQMS